MLVGAKAAVHRDRIRGEKAQKQSKVVEESVPGEEFYVKNAMIACESEAKQKSYAFVSNMVELTELYKHEVQKKNYTSKSSSNVVQKGGATSRKVQGMLEEIAIAAQQGNAKTYDVM